jgi:16S rRNA (guanine527-N7)-methyltransferase
MSEFNAVLAAGCAGLGLKLQPDALSSFEKYHLYLADKNASLNLTAVTGERESAERHFLDSLALLCFADLKYKKVIDVGTGNGFPGLPLKIAEPSIELTLLDSIGKKVDFLIELCSHLGINAVCTQGRAEELALLPPFREVYDICVSRALARLNVLAELCLPLVKVGGLLLAMKARDCGDELAEAQNSIAVLGGEVVNIHEYAVGSVTRSVIVIRKTGNTPSAYPRRFSKIQKQPL